MHGIQQGSVNATLLLSPPHPASVSLGIKREKTLAQRLGRSTVRSWIGRLAWTRKAWKRMGKQRNPSGQITSGSSATSQPLGAPQLCPLRFTVQGRGTQCSPNRLTRGPRTRTPARRLCGQLELFRPSCQEPASVGSAHAEVEGRERPRIFIGGLSV